MALTKVKNVIDITADTMSDLLSMEHKTGSVQLLGYHERGDGGGGVFYWDDSKSQSEHNGGTIIAGDAVLGTWDTAGQEAWFTAPSAGVGCWVREYSGAVNVKWFGDTTSAVIFCINNSILVRVEEPTTINIPEDVNNIQNILDCVLAPNIDITINIQSGHELLSGCGVYSGEFSNFKIVSEDSIVPVSNLFTGHAIRPEIIGEVGEAPRLPLFFGWNASMPELGCVIDMKKLEGSGYFGVNSSGVVRNNCGVINSGFRGLQWRGGNIWAEASNFSGARGCGIRVQKAGQAVVSLATINDCITDQDTTLGALYVSRSSIVEARYITINNSGFAGIMARRSVVTADNCVINNPSNVCVIAETGSKVSVVGGMSDVSSSGGLYARFSSDIAAGAFTMTNATNAHLAHRVSDGSTISKNVASTVNGAATNIGRYSSVSRYVNTANGDGVIYDRDNPPQVYVEKGSDYLLKKYNDGTMEITYRAVLNTGTVAASSFSSALSVPSIPVLDTFTTVTSVSMSGVGRTSVNAGGNRLACTAFYRTDAYPSSELKIRNEAQQLDGASTTLNMESVVLTIMIVGTYN